MTLRHAIGLSAAVGLAVCLIFIALEELREIRGDIIGETLLRFLDVRFMFWPTSIGLIGIGAAPRWSPGAVVILGLTAVTNAAVYAVLGSLTWLGFKVHRTFLVVVALAVGFWWWSVFQG